MRSLLIAIAWIGQALGDCQGDVTADMGLAPSKPGEDERIVADHWGFHECEAVTALFAIMTGGRLTGRTYTISKRWGRVLRARMHMPGEGSTPAPILTCWGSGPAVGISVDFYGPDITETPGPRK